MKVGWLQRQPCAFEIEGLRTFALFSVLQPNIMRRAPDNDRSAVNNPILDESPVSGKLGFLGKFGFLGGEFLVLVMIYPAFELPVIVVE